MGTKSKLTDTGKLEVVLMLLRREEPAAVLVRRYGISDATLHRWRDELLEGGQATLASSKGLKAGSTRRLHELERELADRERVIGELTIANRVLKKCREGWAQRNDEAHRERRAFPACAGASDAGAEDRRDGVVEPVSPAAGGSGA